MKETAQIIRLQQKQEARFICSACGAERGCDCNAPAIEKMLHVREQERQKKQRYREKLKGNVHVDTPVENTEEFEEDDNFLEDNGDYSPVDMAAGRAARTRGFLYRAQQSVFAAEAENFVDLEITKEMVAATRKVVQAWTKTLKRMERKSKSPPRRVRYRPGEELRFFLEANELVLCLCDDALAARVRVNKDVLQMIDKIIESWTELRNKLRSK
jgi:hypothetical protein